MLLFDITKFVSSKYIFASSKKSFWISIIAFLGMINWCSSFVIFCKYETANLLVSVDTKLIFWFLISNNAPFNSNFGLLLSIAGVIFLIELIKLIVEIDNSFKFSDLFNAWYSFHM